MSKKEKQYKIYIRSLKVSVPVDKQTLDEYYRPINAYRRTAENHGRCICPEKNRLMCDMDCLTCPYHTSGDMSYLDDNRIDESGNEMPRLDKLQAELPNLNSPTPEEIVLDSAEAKLSYCE